MTQQLNSRQREAVRHTESPLLVLAGAGSGKTSVITHKIAWLIQEQGLQPEQITAVTFTNKASREMRDRVSSLLGSTYTSSPVVSTFHTLGLNFIRKELEHLPLRRGFSILDAEDCRKLLKDLALIEGDSDAAMVELAQNTISNWKNELRGPQQAISYASSDNELHFAILYQKYNDSLRAYNAVDFDDLIQLPVELLQQNSDVALRWQSRVRYLLVDEYQDTNLTQYQLVKLLVGERQALTVVGDDDQSIYAWRGARPENLAQLKEDFPRLQVIKLEQNYRSTGTILNAANQLIANNPHVFEKSLWSELGPGDPINLVRTENEEAETEWIVDDIQFKQLTTRNSWSDFAVLYRGNHQAKLLEIKLQAAKIPYQVSGGSSFYNRTEIRDIMAYLRILSNPDDDNALLRIINTPRRQIGSQTIQQLNEYAAKRHVGLLKAMTEFGFQSQLQPQAATRITKFSNWLCNLSRHFLDRPIEAMDELLNDIDYEGWLHQNASSPKVAEGRWNNVKLLVSSLGKIIEDEQSGSDPEEAVSRLLLRELLEEQAEEAAGNQAQLLTLHASKGLEFRQVYLMGLEETLLPHRNSIEQDSVEEERRLFYVGITRAQRNLTMTMANQRSSFGETYATTPSRFIAEIPETLIRKEGFGPIDPEQEAEKIEDARASLRALFS